MRLLLVLAALASAAVLAPSAMSSASLDRGTVTVASSDYGRILFDGRGFALYAFTKVRRTAPPASAPARSPGRRTT